MRALGRIRGVYIRRRVFINLGSNRLQWDDHKISLGTHKRMGASSIRCVLHYKFKSLPGCGIVGECFKVGLCGHFSAPSRGKGTSIKSRLAHLLSYLLRAVGAPNTVLAKNTVSLGSGAR